MSSGIASPQQLNGLVDVKEVLSRVLAEQIAAAFGHQGEWER